MEEKFNLLTYRFRLYPRVFKPKGAISPFNVVRSHWGTNPDNEMESIKQWHFRLFLN